MLIPNGVLISSDNFIFSFLMGNPLNFTTVSKLLSLGLYFGTETSPCLFCEGQSNCVRIDAGLRMYEASRAGSDLTEASK